jgi:hypothetical protein
LINLRPDLKYFGLRMAAATDDGFIQEIVHKALGTKERKRKERGEERKDRKTGLAEVHGLTTALCR